MAASKNLVSADMKKVLTILLLIITKFSFAQNAYSYSDIDWKVQSIDAPAPDSLSKLLTTPYTTDLQKVRAIFSWIAQHVSYNTFVISSNRKIAKSKYVVEPDDTSAEWKSAVEMTAIKVLKKRTAVCDGYAKLFKTLCDYANIRSEIITGYARGYIEGEDKFRSNHTWNAVMIDSVWQLLDVTWASGYINYTNQFAPGLNDAYFLTPPQQFIHDHYPEDITWTLLDDPPTMNEFKRMPYTGKSFVKYSISSYSPANGIIEAAAGDSIRIEVSVKNAERDKHISPDPFFDSTIIDRSPLSVFIAPSDTVGNKFIYSYVVPSTAVGWINIVYNKDVIMRYRLNIKKDVAVKWKEE